MFGRVLALMFLTLISCNINLEERIEECEIKYQGCIEPLNFPTDQWTFIETDLQCELNYRACINYEPPIQVSCDEIFVLCQQDAAWSSWLVAQIKYLECDQGFEECIYYEYY